MERRFGDQRPAVRDLASDGNAPSGGLVERVRWNYEVGEFPSGKTINFRCRVALRGRGCVTVCQTRRGGQGAMTASCWATRTSCMG